MILTGRLLETKTKENASNAVRKLLDLKPRTARIVKPIIKEDSNDNKDSKNSNTIRTNQNVSSNSELKLLSKEFKEIEIPVEQIVEGDFMIIKPGERIPTDGIIVEGRLIFR